MDFVLQNPFLRTLTVDIFIDEGEKAEATAIVDARMIAVVFIIQVFVLWYYVLTTEEGKEQRQINIHNDGDTLGDSHSFLLSSYHVSEQSAL